MSQISPFVKKIMLALLALIAPVALWWGAQGLSTDLGAKPDGVESAAINQSAGIREAPVYRFAAFGDWGAGTPFQRDVAKQLATRYEQSPFSEVLLLGDNIYPVGDVKKFGDAYFTQMYAPLLDNGVRFIAALGNHDIAGGFENDQIAFFHMDGRYYAVRPELPENGPSVEFFIIDTNTFARDTVQQQWLKRALAASQATWKIVAGHHPILSSGEHQSNSGLQKTLAPILADAHVPFYLAGHDHEYERFAPVNGVNYIVSGGAGAYLRAFDKIAPGSKVRHKAHHFLLFELYPEAMRMQAIDKHGTVLDTLTVEQPARQAASLKKAG